MHIKSNQFIPKTKIWIISPQKRNSVTAEMAFRHRSIIWRHFRPPEFQSGAWIMLLLRDCI